jgi:hypothetical protein
LQLFLRDLSRKIFRPIVADNQRARPASIDVQSPASAKTLLESANEGAVAAEGFVVRCSALPANGIV